MEEKLDFTPATAASELSAKLKLENPGLLYWTIKPSKYGRAQLVPGMLRAESSFREPGNIQPVSFVQLTSDEQKQILSFALLPEGNGILASVLVQTQATPAKHEVWLIRYPIAQPIQNQVIITKGNIDLTPFITKNSDVLFASNRTGRLDLWKCRLQASDSEKQKLDLVQKRTVRFDFVDGRRIAVLEGDSAAIWRPGGAFAVAEEFRQDVFRTV